MTRITVGRSKRASGLAFPVICRLADLPEPVAEFKFHPTRKWRFDFAWPEYLLALEREGGVFLTGGGRHTRGSGFRADLEKYNEAAALGWRILRVLPEQLESPAVFGWIRRCVHG